jgi:hypothetical protein
MSLTKRWLDELTEQGAIEMPIIYAYGDRDALEDGVLIDIASLGLTFEGAPINRITAALFWQEQKNYPLTEAQLIEQLADCEDDQEPVSFDLEAFGKVIAAQLPAVGGHGYLRTLPGSIWLVENEVNGWTLMLPADY